MQAIVFRYSLPRFAFAFVAGRLSPRAYVCPAGPTRIESVPDPSLLGDDWTIVRTARCGICGSDVKQVYLDGNFDNPLTALISFPAVLGHEAVGTVEEIGPAVRNVRAGDRVALNPWLSCGPRGVAEPCDACRQGRYSLCEHYTDGPLPAGMHNGNCCGVTGAYAPYFPAHASQLFSVPDGVSFDQAVLADPFSVCLHAILQAPPAPGARVLVYGAGVLGLLSVVVLRALYPATQIVLAARYPHQAEWGRRLGADVVLETRAPEELIERIAELAGAPIQRPRNAGPWLLRGVDAVYDTVGSKETLEVALRVASPRAPIVLTGVGVPARFEWTPLYFKELRVIGSNAFGLEELEGERKHAIAHYLALVAGGRIDPAGLVTHRFRLEQYADAFTTLHHKGAAGVVKACFDFE